MNSTPTSTRQDAYKAARIESGNTGYYSGQEMDGLKVAAIDDEIEDLKARIKELRKERRDLVDNLTCYHDTWMRDYMGI